MGRLWISSLYDCHRIATFNLPRVHTTREQAAIMSYDAITANTAGCYTNALAIIMNLERDTKLVLDYLYSEELLTCR